MSARVAVGYVRVSTDDQVQNYSLDTQERVIREWSQRRDVPLAEIIRFDEGQSGKSLDRTGFQALETRVAKGDVGWVVVARLDRLTRSLPDLAGIMRSWESSGVRIMAPADGIDDPASKQDMWIFFRGLMAQWERERIILRSRPGREARAAAGLPLGKPPFGYRVSKVIEPASGRSASKLALDAETAPMAAAIFSEAAEHDSGARRLAAWASQRFGRPFSPGMIQRMLANPAYIGTLQVEANGRRHVRPHNHEPIVSEDLFAQVQAKRGQRQRDTEHGARDSAASSWLGGIARCGVCGKLVQARRCRETKREEYHCESRIVGGSCGAPAWPREEVDTWAWGRLHEKLIEDIESLRREVNMAVDELPRYLDERRAAAARLIERIDAELSASAAQLEDGQMAAEDYALRVKQLRQQRVDADALLQDVDGDTWLARLAMTRAGRPSSMHPEVAALMASNMPQQPGTVRYLLPLPVVLAGLSLGERRRLARALCNELRLLPAFPFAEVRLQSGRRPYGQLSAALSAHLLR